MTESDPAIAPRDKRGGPMCAEALLAGPDRHDQTDRFNHLISARRSVRSYGPRPVTPETLYTLLDAARHAPSPHNSQPWRFALVQGFARRDRMLRAMASPWRDDLAAEGMADDAIEALLGRSRRRVIDAPAVVVVFLEPPSDVLISPRRTTGEQIMAIQAVGAAIQVILLAAAARGLGSCWICSPLFASDEVTQTLEVPRRLQAQALITLGYPAEPPKYRGRRALHELIVFDDSP